MNFDQVIDRRNSHSLKWGRYGADVLPMWVADMDFQAPEPAREVLQRAVEHGVFGYEMPSQKLAEIVAARMERLYGWKFSPEAVVATPGIVAGFKAAARTTGGGVLIHTPVYPPFLEVAAHCGCVYQHAPLAKHVEDHLVSYSVDWDAFSAGLNSNGAKTGMLLLCHPHNPTGQIYAQNDLQQMAEMAINSGAVICSDEVHSELVLDKNGHTPLASLHAEFANRSITLISPSKTFNLVGLFCGFAIIPELRLRTRYKRVLNELALHVSSLGLQTAEVAFSGACDAWLDEARAYLTANRDIVVDFVKTRLPGVRVTIPQATYLAWLDFEEWVKDGRIKPDPYTFFLDNARVALNKGAEFGPGGEHFVRLNFACPKSILMEGLERMQRSLLPR